MNKSDTSKIGNVAGTTAGVGISSITGIPPSVTVPVMSAIGGFIGGIFGKNPPRKIESVGTGSYASGGMVKYSAGGMTEYRGKPHEGGGIKTEFGEVEDGETQVMINNKPYIFSNRIKVPGTDKTFAQVSKEPNINLNTLAAKQEQISGRNKGESNSTEYAYGGTIDPTRKFKSVDMSPPQSIMEEFADERVIVGQPNPNIFAPGVGRQPISKYNVTQESLIPKNPIYIAQPFQGQGEGYSSQNKEFSADKAIAMNVNSQAGKIYKDRFNNALNKPLVNNYGKAGITPKLELSSSEKRDLSIQQSQQQAKEKQIADANYRAMQQARNEQIGKKTDLKKQQKKLGNDASALVNFENQEIENQLFNERQERINNAKNAPLRQSVTTPQITVGQNSQQYNDEQKKLDDLLSSTPEAKEVGSTTDGITRDFNLNSSKSISKAKTDFTGLKNFGKDLIPYAGDIINAGRALFEKDNIPKQKVNDSAYRKIPTHVDVNPQLESNARATTAMMSNPNATATDRALAMTSKQRADSEVYATKTNQENNLAMQQANMMSNIAQRQEAMDNQYNQAKMATDANRSNMLSKSIGDASTRYQSMIKDGTMNEMELMKMDAEIAGKVRDPKEKLALYKSFIDSATNPKLKQALTDKYNSLAKGI